MSSHIHWTISIHELPPELLIYIFHLVRDASLKRSIGFRFGKAFELDWIKVSFVSRRWRELAIGSPSLWAHIDLTIPHVAVEMLRRSQTVPIHLHTCLGRGPSSSFETRKPLWLDVLHNIYRAKELHLPHINRKDLKFINKNVDGPTLPLESILIRTTRLSQLSRLFELPMPSLRVLDLESIIIPRPLPALPQLVTLTLYSWRDDLLTGPERLASLEAMPMLEDVDLFRMLLPFAPDTASSALARHRPVNIPKLKRFSIDSYNPEIVYIVKALRYPPEAAITITCGEFCFTEATTEAAVNSCSRLRNYPFPLSSAYIYFDESQIDLDALTSNHTKAFSLTLGAVSSPGPSGSFLRRLCTVFSWESIEEVALHLEEWPGSLAEVTALWSAVKLVVVPALDPSLQPMFFEELRDLPKLETLEFYECENKSSIPSLVDMFHHRQACGLPLPRLLSGRGGKEVSIESLITLADEATRHQSLENEPESESG